MSAEPQPPRPAGGDARHYAIVGTLLLLIIVLLGTLWLRERKAVSTLGRELDAARRNAGAQAQLQALLGRAMTGRATTRPLARDDLPVETVTWNGAPRPVRHISPAAGERLGLKPGDVIVVSPPPATRPTTQPQQRTR